MNKLIYTFVIILIVHCTFNIENCEAQWIRQNPVPSGEAIKCFYFHPNSSSGWAGGNAGLLLKTTDFGNSWVLHPQPVFSCIKEIRFLNSQTGWFTSYYNNYYSYSIDVGLYKTTNGGLNWDFVINYSSAFNFFDANNGVMLFQPDVIGKTTNGGYNWLLYTIGALTNECMYFLNNQTGYAAGYSINSGVIYKTINGGVNWTLLSNSFPGNHFNSVYFSDEQNGLLIGYGNNSIKCFKTSNGGSNWITNSTNLDSPAVSTSFINFNTGYVINNYKCAGTTNGGLNWSVIRDTSYYFNTALYFKNKDSGIVCNQGAQLNRTLNAGINWQNIYGLNNSELKDIKFFDNNTGWAIGGKGVVWRTTNSGTNWIYFAADSNCTLKSLSIINNQTSWVGGTNSVTGSRLFQTTNGGINWVAKASPSRDISKIYFNDINNGWVAFDSLYRTTNGGASWENKGIYSSYNEFKSLQFIDSQTGWISGWDMFKTTNGGSNWFLIPYAGGNANDNMFFINAQTGWIGWLNSNNNGENVYKTTNGGYNWVQVIIWGGNYIENIKFVNQNSGWVISSPYVFKTTNGGNNWNKYALPTNNIINSIYFVNENTGWIAGENSTIIKSINGGVGITKTDNIVPDGFKLHQNYPNPFNPTTTIKFDVQKAGDVKIKVYDLMGREVQTLVNERLQPGTYETTFDGSQLSSGVYYYKLISDNYTYTKKMVLLK